MVLFHNCAGRCREEEEEEEEGRHVKSRGGHKKAMRNNQRA